MNNNDGVEPGNAAYMREPAIGRMHARHTGRDPLAIADIQFVLSQLADKKPGWIADFGCGTGRTFSDLGRAGWKVIGVDMSRPMLDAAQRQKTDETDFDGAIHPPVLIQSSLTNLAGFQPGSLDAAICLYSTLGMIRGCRNRHKFLKAAHETVRDGGTFIVHAHNVWIQRKFPGGKRWLATSLLRSLVSKCEFGDRWANAYGVNGLFIHSFRFGELIRDLSDAGWKTEICLVHDTPKSADDSPNQKPVAAVSRREKANALGWIIACRKT